MGEAEHGPSTAASGSSSPHPVNPEPPQTAMASNGLTGAADDRQLPDATVRAQRSETEQGQTLEGAIIRESNPTEEGGIKIPEAVAAVEETVAVVAAPKQRRKLGRNRALRMSVDPFSLPAPSADSINGAASSSQARFYA